MTSSQRPLWQRGLNYLNNRRIRYSPRNLRIRWAAWNAYRLRQQAEKAFTILNEADFKATRTSDTIFVYGSGTSLHDITPAEWAFMGRHNTLGFTLFTYQQFVRVDYHLIRELQVGYELETKRWQQWYHKFTDEFDRSPFYKETILVAQDGWGALVSNRMIGLKMLQTPRRLLPFQVSGRIEGQDEFPIPSTSLTQGLAHGSGTLTDCINLAAIGGWKNIVLVGVDLYGKKYFYDTDHHEKPDQTTQTHGTVRTGILKNLDLWRDVLAERGHTVWVYNPLSLLTQILPLYRMEEHLE